jgi:5'-deoxynucleotidase YfbR-like HD superfamily hydrolase
VALIYETIFGQPTAEVERYIRLHDVAELVVGDPPFPIKAQNPDLKAVYDRIEPDALKRMGLTLPELDVCERNRVKIADLLEMFTYGLVEVEMGNRLAQAVVDRTSDAALRLAEGKLTGDDHRAVCMYVHGELKRHEEMLR